MILNKGKRARCSTEGMKAIQEERRMYMSSHRCDASKKPARMVGQSEIIHAHANTDVRVCAQPYFKAPGRNT